MRPLRKLLIYVGFIFLGAALLAPWIYRFAQWVATDIPALEKIAENPFYRYANRCLILLALVGLWPFLKSLGIHSWRDLGFAPLRSHWRTASAGFFVGFSSLALLAGLVILFGARIIDFRHSGSALAGELLGAIFTAVIVAILEESLYRGALFGALRKIHSWQFALITSSAIYALLHFFAKPEPPVSINWLSGFTTIAGMLAGFVELQKLVPGFLNLFIVGVILGFAFQRTGNLYFSIGLHAGWIFWLKSYGLVTSKAARTDFWIWGGKKMIDGWIATAILLTVLALLLVRHKTARKNLYAA
jgi:uncharacterized protein